MSGKIYADNKDQQVIDYKYLIGVLNLEISMAEVYGNEQGMYGGINALGRLLNHLYDSLYKEDMKKIDEMIVPAANTPNQIRQVNIEMTRKKMELKHEALIRLAYRKRLLPAATSGAKGGYEVGDEFD